MSFKHFLNELNGNRVEGELVKTLFLSLITSLVTLGFLYLFFLKNVSNLIDKYGIFLFFSALSYAIIMLAVRQVRAYKELVCMSGMMIGMTTGMIAGFLPGFYVASTNGMFFGGFFGVLIGIFFGVWMGKCCGVMGVMEGIMAGFMGGLMGAMTSFMLLNDHLNYAAVIVFVISTIIIIGLNYMIYQETRESERERNEDYFLIIILTFILIALTTALIVFGPRGGALG